MKKLLSSIVMLALATVFVSAQGSVAPASQTGPVMMLEAVEVDYGVVEQGADPFRVIKFTNTGNAPLVIENAKGNCGCTVPSYPKEPIAPGETSELKVRYDTNRVGKINKMITLTTNEGVQTRTIRVLGEVKAKPSDPEGVPASTGGF